MCLNESPSEKEGKYTSNIPANVGGIASMKALPKRKGNAATTMCPRLRPSRLNESPSEKEGKLPKVKAGKPT